MTPRRAWMGRGVTFCSWRWRRRRGDARGGNLIFALRRRRSIPQRLAKPFPPHKTGAQA